MHPNNRTVKNSEFAYHDTSDPKGAYHLSPFVNRLGGFYNRKTSEPFS
jgi:hypothetical protein